MESDSLIWFRNLASKVIHDTHERLMREGRAGIFGPLYVWYRESEGARAGEIVIAEDAPGPEFKLAFNERVPTHLTWDGLYYWFHRFLGRLPVLPVS